MRMELELAESIIGFLNGNKIKYIYFIFIMGTNLLSIFLFKTFQKLVLNQPTKDKNEN